MAGHIIHIKPTHNYLMSMEDLHHLGKIMAQGPDGKADVPHEVRRRLVDQLIMYYQLHVESLREVHSLKILRELQ
jgi:hypothetical protein